MSFKHSVDEVIEKLNTMSIDARVDPAIIYIRLMKAKLFNLKHLVTHLYAVVLYTEEEARDNEGRKIEI